MLPIQISSDRAFSVFVLYPPFTLVQATSVPWLNYGSLQLLPPLLLLLLSHLPSPPPPCILKCSSDNVTLHKCLLQSPVVFKRKPQIFTWCQSSTWVSACLPALPLLRLSHASAAGEAHSGRGLCLALPSTSSACFIPRFFAGVFPPHSFLLSTHVSFSERPF